MQRVCVYKILIWKDLCIKNIYEASKYNYTYEDGVEDCVKTYHFARVVYHESAKRHGIGKNRI